MKANVPPPTELPPTGHLAPRVGFIFWVLTAIAVGLLAWNYFYPPWHTSLPKWLDEHEPSLEIVAR